MVAGPGYAADLVVFDSATVGPQRTELVGDLPGGAARLLQRANGVEYVAVNGGLLIDRGQQGSIRSGRVLRAEA